jgi:RHH-type proline utilization regulon transcriptional repressor/proline dehydrogenase/delta 1-pyrroline-5-carboxylate dehydrogenase
MASNSASELAGLLAGFEIDESSDRPEAVQKAVQLARQLQLRGTELQTPQERRQQRELERMMNNPGDKATLMQLTDQAFRSKTAGRAADQLVHILDVHVSVPMVKERMREETANVVLPAEDELLSPYLASRRESGVRMNVNYLGEALLGEDDAKRRLKSYLAALQLPAMEVISVKISTIYSQISAISRRNAVKVLCDRMELLYRAAAKERFERADGSKVPKFVYLDMEGAGAREQRWRAGDHPSGEGCQHGDGARRGLHRRMVAGDLSGQG